MKTVKAGEIPEKAKPWWINKVAVCPKCKAEIQLEENDEHLLMQYATRGLLSDPSYVSFLCTTVHCGTKIKIFSK